MEQQYREMFGEVRSSSRLQEEVRKMSEMEREPIKKRFPKKILIAAAVLVVLAGTAVAVFSGAEIRFLDTADLEDYYDRAPFLKNLEGKSVELYQATGHVETTPLESLSQQARDDAAAGKDIQEFSSWDEAADYLGIELSGPAEETSLQFTMEEDEIAEIKFSFYPQVGDGLAVTVRGCLYTECFTGVPGDFYAIHDDTAESQQEERSLSGGEIAQIVFTSWEDGNGLICGFFTRGQVFYSVDVLYLEGHEEQAGEVLETFLNEL